jgi:hypothetical protein
MPDMKTKTWFLKFTYFKESILTAANQNENNVTMKSEAEHKDSWWATSSWSSQQDVAVPTPHRRCEKASAEPYVKRPAPATGRSQGGAYQ